MFLRRDVVRCHVSSSNRPSSISRRVPDLFPNVQSGMLEVLRSRSAPNRRGDGPPKWKHRHRGERWTEPLRLGLESESPRRRGIERPLEKLLGDHGVDELITGVTPPVDDIYGRGLSDVMRFVMCPPLSNVVSTRRGARNTAGVAVGKAHRAQSLHRNYTRRLLTDSSNWVGCNLVRRIGVGFRGNTPWHRNGGFTRELRPMTEI